MYVSALSSGRGTSLVERHCFSDFRIRCLMLGYLSHWGLVRFDQVKEHWDGENCVTPTNLPAFPMSSPNARYIFRSST